jgi:glycosyltransferase involved in cell wall biosynthesis
MRIAYITQSYPPMISGAAIVVERLAQGMAERGHATMVLAASDKGQAYTEQVGHARIVRLASLPNPKRANQYFVPTAFRKIAQELLSFEPDILHIHDMIYLGVVGIAVARSKRCPVIGTVHQLPWFISAYLPDLPGLKLPLERSLWSYSRWVNKQCDAVIAPTPTIAHTIQSETGSRAIDISNGVDLSRFTPEPAQPDEKEYLCQKHALDPDRPIILHVGRLDVDKNVEKVIRAAAKTLRATNAQLLVVGDGECKGSLQALANQLGISEYCRFLGFVASDGDLPGLYRMADVFTTASQIETQGLVLLEALASGLPVVAVEATCIPELVKDSVTGYLVPPNDVDALVNRLARVIENPARAKEMGRRGRALARKHAIEHTLDRHENLYRKHVALRQAAPKRQTVQMRRNRLWRSPHS